MEKRVLGKGLSALIPEKISSVKEGSHQEEVAFLNIDIIKDNSQQPRKNYDVKTMDELKASIKEKGLLQPLLVRKIDAGYEVIAGERRLRAARALNMKEVPVVVKNVSNEEALVLALIENIQREELNAIEEGLAYKRLLEDYHLTYEQVAQSVGKDISTVSNMVRLLKLPKGIQDKVVSGEISMGHARALVGVEDAHLQNNLFQIVLNKKISVRELENLIRTAPVLNAKKKKEQKDHEIVYLEEELQKLLGTKVKIQARKKQGKLIIEYYSVDDLDRILKILRKNAAVCI
ncbi:MAG TPA: ParB/RepB/Spo0J family partition protein [Candidatus Omnitrophota bacterium]|nr:ParB/RepB/Spo0J family partition protein [Candidatus Omnitrophota bacterium]